MNRAGWALLASWLAWVVVTATINHRAQPLMTPYFTSPLVLLAGVLIGRRLASRAADVWVALSLLAASAYVWWSSNFVSGATGGPLGYANSNAALAVQLVALAALVALDVGVWLRVLLLGTAVLSAAAVLPTKSDAANVILVPLIAAIVVAHSVRLRSRWWSVALGAGGVLGAAATMTVLTILPTWPDNRLLRSLSTTRHELWRDALRLWVKHPLTGSGPGAFRQFSPLAKNPHLETAHMSLFQIGAETGLVGVLLFAALVALGFAMAARGRPPATLVASAALASLLIHSFIDHILEFWPVMLVVGVSLGYVSSTRHQVLVADGLSAPAGDDRLDYTSRPPGLTAPPPAREVSDSRPPTITSRWASMIRAASSAAACPRR